MSIFAYGISIILKYNLQAKSMDSNVDTKGKGKIDPSDDLGLPYILQTPPFVLEIGYRDSNKNCWYRDIHNSRIIYLIGHRLHIDHKHSL